MTDTRRTIPEGLDLITSPRGIVIRKVWRSWKLIPMALFAVAWDSFLFFWYTQAFSTPNPPLMMVIFPIGHVAVGVGLTYYIVAAFVNSTDVTISSSGVQVKTGPAPWIGNKEVRVEDIRDILVRERAANRGARTYNVMYADRSRKERKLIAWIPHPDQAEFIAETIRDTLGLAPGLR
jgi:hypothetical protein